MPGPWRVALRIARRSALGSWGRSLLVVLLIALPIAGLTAAAVVLPSSTSTLPERIQGNLGHAQARLTVVGGPEDGIEQGVEGGADFSLAAGGGGDATRIDPRTVLPAGTRVLPIGSGAATFATAHGATSLQVATGETWDPSLDGGPYVLLSGRRPTAADEVLLSPAALDRLGATVGGTIRELRPAARTLTVVGTSRDRSLAESAQTVFAAASAVGLGTAPTDVSLFYVPSTPIGWSTVVRLNRIGTTVFSREVVADPPPAALRLGSGTGSPFDLNAAATAAIVLMLVFIVLEVALLAGSAFLVGARQQQRMLAVVASVGADRSVLRAVVTASGLVLGAIGGVVGLALGIGAALVFMRITGDGSWTRYPGVHLLWPLLVGIVAFGVLVGWIAALVPARAASRFDVVRALRGARTPQRIGRRPVAGVVLLLAGVVITLLGGGALLAALKVTGPSQTAAQLGALALLGGGPVLAQLGVLLCAGLILRGIARLLGRAPLAARLAARDTSRNLGRAVPAVASVMTTVFIAAFVMCVGNSASITSALSYTWYTATPGTGMALVPTPDAAHAPATVATWTAVLRQDLPVADSATLATSPSGGDDPTPSDRTADALPWVHVPSAPSSCSERDRVDAGNLRCGPFTAGGGSVSSAQNTVSVGDAHALGLLLGHAPSAAAEATLAAGGAVALRSDLAPDGRATLDWFTPKQLTGDWWSAHPKRTTAITAVVDLPANPIQDALFVTPATATRLGIPFQDDRVLTTFTRPPTDAELDTVNAALSGLANQPDGRYFTVEHGPQDYGSMIAWYVLLACLVIAISAGATAIGLARVDGRADDLTLASLGAPPRIRRSVAFVQAVVICGLGAVVGTALGLLPAVALGVATSALPFAPPQLQLVLVAVGIPVVIAAGSWLLVGNRGDLTRREAIG